MDIVYGGSTSAKKLASLIHFTKEEDKTKFTEVMKIFKENMLINREMNELRTPGKKRRKEEPPSDLDVKIDGNKATVEYVVGKSKKTVPIVKVDGKWFISEEEEAVQNYLKNVIEDEKKSLEDARKRLEEMKKKAADKGKQELEVAMWSVGKTAVGAVKVAIEVYRARHSGELAAEFGAGGLVTAIETLIKLETHTLADLKYFNPGSFSYTIVNNAAPIADEFVITLNAAIAPKPGGPTTGAIIYYSATGIWVVPN